MSRCFPYPPPGFVKKGICDETLIESIKVLLSIVALWVFDFVLDVLCSIRFDSLLMGISLLICVIMKTQKERGIKNHMNCIVGIEIDNSSSNSLNASIGP